ncbi:hypothetical protein ACKVWC_011469 [Pyricularia oryzae]
MATQRAVGLAAKTRPVQAYKDAALDARRERARLSKREFKPIPDRPRGSDKYRQQQKLAMQSWKIFFTQVYETDPDDAYQADPDQIWLDLCNRGTEAYNGAIHCCQQFLKDYVRASERPVVSTGPEERRIERSINRDLSVRHFWESLVVAADRTILSEKRRSVTSNPDKWTLSTTQSHKSRGSGPVWQISHWIASDLANELELTKKQTFVKVAATTADILVVLMTLWTRANDIPCDRETRVAFHARILLASMGGFRRGTLDKLKYSQIKMHLSRPGKKAVENMSVFGDLTLYYNKQQTDKICTSQDDVIEIGLKNTHDPLVDLVRIVAAQAIKDGAFDPPYHSWEDLEKPRDAEYAQLHWKKEMLDREIFALSHETERALWYRTLLVAGYREPMRLYSIRVGAGARLDKSFTSAQRNYVLSNSNKVFEEYYQPRNFDGDLVQVAFGEHARGNDELFKRMREASFKRNENAPIYVTQEDLESFQKREDISELRAEYARLKETARVEKRAKHEEGKSEINDKSEAEKEAARVLSHISKTIANLCASTLKGSRAEFFERVDREEGDKGKFKRDLQTLHVNPQKPRHIAAGNAAVKIGQILRGDIVRGDTFSKALLSFLQCKDDAIAPCPEAAQEVESKEPTLAQKPTCILCGRSFTLQRNLIRHTKVHCFQQPFDCPACKSTINSASDWARHVVDSHGTQNASRLKAKKAAKKSHLLSAIQLAQLDSSKSTCYICGSSFTRRKNLTRHNREVHHHEGLYDRPFPCPACKAQEKDHIITNAMEWSNHVEKVHGKLNAPGLPENKDSFARKRKRNEHRPKEGNEASNIQQVVGKKRKVPDKGRLEIYDGKVALCLFCKMTMEPGRCFSKHLGKKHRGRFESEIHCPKCLELDEEVAILGRYDWSRHIAEVHGGDNGALLVEAAGPSEMTCVKDVGVSGIGALLEPSITDTVIDPFLRDV